MFSRHLRFSVVPLLLVIIVVTLLILALSPLPQSKSSQANEIIPQAKPLVIRQTITVDEQFIYKYTSPDANCTNSKTVAIMILLRDKTSWGPKRSFDSFWQLIQSFDYDKSCLSLNLLISDPTEFAHIQKVIDGKGVFQFASIKLLQHYESPKGSIAYEDRHKDNLQKNDVVASLNYATSCFTAHWKRNKVSSGLTLMLK